MGSTCIAYFKFNGNANDACTDDSISLTLSGGASTSSAGKMGNGLTLNGVGGRAIGSDDGSLDISTDWSIEAWINHLRYLLEELLLLWLMETEMKKIMNYPFTLTVLMR